MAALSVSGVMSDADDRRLRDRRHVRRSGVARPAAGGDADAHRGGSAAADVSAITQPRSFTRCPRGRSPTSRARAITYASRCSRTWGPSTAPSSWPWSSSSPSSNTRIDLAVLGYAITSMRTETYRPARLILLGEDAPPELRRATSLDAIVTASAPPFFIWHTAEDPYVPVEHSYRLAAALAAHKVPHALPRRSCSFVPRPCALVARRNKSSHVVKEAGLEPWPRILRWPRRKAPPPCAQAVTPRQSRSVGAEHPPAFRQIQGAACPKRRSLERSPADMTGGEWANETVAGSASVGFVWARDTGPC